MRAFTDLRPKLKEGFVLPAWFVSLLFHVMLGILLMTQLQSCQQSKSLGDNTEYREIGLYSRPNPLNDSQEVETTESNEQPDPTRETTSNSEANPNQQTTQAPTAAPPIPLQLPKRDPLPTLGAGAMQQATSPSEFIQEIQSLPNAQSPRAQLPPPGEVRFFGIDAEGRSFIFIIDMSDSMADYNALQLAKREVLAGIENLKTDQRFSVIFYNDNHQVLRDRTGKTGLFFANDIHKTSARNFISSKTPSGGTDHYPAIMEALNLGSEVIFFLTDADKPRLTPSELEKIKRRNNGRASIHTVKFGKYDDLKINDFLRRLASQNNGTYRYRKVGG